MICCMSDINEGKKYAEFDEDVIGGTELHVRFTLAAGDPGLFVEFTPPHTPAGEPEGLEDINNRLAGLCRSYVLDMDDRTRHRLLKLAEKDGGNDRMLYRLVVAGKVLEDGSRRTRVVDRIDPAFAELDSGIAGRALACRQEIEQVLAGGKPRTVPDIVAPNENRARRRRHDRISAQACGHGVAAGIRGRRPHAAPGAAESAAPVPDDQRWERSEPVFELIDNVKCPPGVKDRTEEEARKGMLEGEEFMILQLMVVGKIEMSEDRESVVMDYLAAMNPNAFSSGWMREKIMLLTDVCEKTITASDRHATNRLFHSIRETGAGELCLYRLSVWAAMNDNGSSRFSIRDEIDPVFLRQDPDVEIRSVETRRLAGNVMAGVVG